MNSIALILMSVFRIMPPLSSWSILKTQATFSSETMASMTQNTYELKNSMFHINLFERDARAATQQFNKSTRAQLWLKYSLETSIQLPAFDAFTPTYSRLANVTNIHVNNCLPARYHMMFINIQNTYCRKTVQKNG
jgi:uncharacterized membrane protein